MKKQFFYLLALATLVTTAGFSKPPGNGTSIIIKEVRLPAHFQRLVTRGSVDVVLFEDSTLLVNIQGKQKPVDGISLTTENGVLTIRNRNSTGRVVVYVPANNLAFIEAYDNSRVSTCTRLSSKLLTLMVNDDCRIAVHSTGRIVIRNGEFTEVDVIKDTQVSPDKKES